MTNEELDNWWKHLPIRRNVGIDEAFATKEEVMNEEYPDCTRSWNELEKADKEFMYMRFGGRSAHPHHTHPKGNASFT